MDVLHFPDDTPPAWLVHPVLALGNFDGLHRGHLKIIERVRRGAAEHGGTPMAMTFDPHPSRIVRPDKAPPLLMTKAQRIEALVKAEKKLNPNVDFYSGLIYQALGFPVEMFTVLFAIPRTVGWLAHMSELLKDKEQKISRPRQWYTGVDERSYVAIAKR